MPASNPNPPQSSISAITVLPAAHYLLKGSRRHRSGARVRAYHQPNRMAGEHDVRLARPATRYASCLARNVSRMAQCSRNTPSKPPACSSAPTSSRCHNLRDRSLRPALKTRPAKNHSTRGLALRQPSRAASAAGMAKWCKFPPGSSRPKDTMAGWWQFHPDPAVLKEAMGAWSQFRRATSESKMRRAAWCRNRDGEGLARQRWLTGFFIIPEPVRRMRKP